MLLKLHSNPSSREKPGWSGSRHAPGFWGAGGSCLGLFLESPGLDENRDDYLHRPRAAKPGFAELGFANPDTQREHTGGTGGLRHWEHSGDLCQAFPSSTPPKRGAGARRVLGIIPGAGGGSWEWSQGCDPTLDPSLGPPLPRKGQQPQPSFMWELRNCSQVSSLNMRRNPFTKNAVQAWQERSPHP